MKEIYHCTPSEFYDQDEAIINLHKEIWNLDAKYTEKKRRRDEQKQKTGRA